jgi:hypothetical protein
MSWQTTAEGHRCDRHDVTFARGEVCGACVTDPAPRIDVVEEANEHDRELEIREAELMAIARRCFRVGRDLLEDGTDRDCAAAAKVIAEGTKAMRFANELRDRLAARSESRAKREHHRRIMGLRKGN